MSNAIKMSAGSAGQLTRGTRMEAVNTFVPGGGGTRQETVWSISATNAAVPYATESNSNNEITFQVDAGCQDLPFTVTFQFQGQSGNTLIQAIADKLKTNPNINGLGNWFRDGSNLKFVSAFPGLNIKVSTIHNPARFNIAQVTNLGGTEMGTHRFKPGTIAHYVPSEPTGAGGRRAIVPPTQDPTANNATQAFAGIVLECDMHEMASPSGRYPDYGNCDQNAALPTVYNVLNGVNAPVTIALEAPHNFGAAGRLHYRIAASVNGSKLGMFRFGRPLIGEEDPDPGLIPVPFAYDIVSWDFGTNVVEIELK